MMEKERLQEYLYENIPLSKAMGVTVDSLSLREVVLRAPLLNNFNHKCTVFGGSLNAVATLACWSLLYLNLQSRKERFEIVITHSEVTYLKSVQEDFHAVSHMCGQTDWDKFAKALDRKKRGRICLEAIVGPKERPALLFKGTFAALSV